MSSVALVTDSTAGLPAEYVAQHGIRVIPLYVKIGDQVYRDGVDMTPDEFYKALPRSAALPTTSQPSVGDFMAVYRDAAEHGASGIISVHISSGISGTVNSATLAKQQLGDLPIEIIDTHCTAASQIFTVEAGVQALAAGASLQEAVATMRRVVEQQKTLFCLETLEYLYKGGRIGGAAALVGSLLQFKPLLCFREGKIDALERVRTSNRALVRILEIMGEWLGKTPVHAWVMEAACPERAATLTVALPRYLNVVSTRGGPITPVLGTHGGPGTLGLCCCPVAAMEFKR